MRTESLSKKPANESSRIPSIDLLKCIAIIFVVIYHTRLFSIDFIAQESFVNYFHYYFMTILSTCVPLFFFANGYLLFSKPFDYKKHIKRTVRLTALVFIWAFIQMPIYLAISKEAISFEKIVNAVLSLSGEWRMHYFWFLGALVSMYVLFPVLKIAYDNHKKSFLFFLFICTFFTFGFKFINEVLNVGSVLLKHSLGSMNQAVFTIFNPFRSPYSYAFVYFCGGGLVYDYSDKIQSLPQQKRIAGSIIGIVLSCSLLFLFGRLYSKIAADAIWDVVWQGYDSVYTLVNVFCIFLLCCKYKGNKIVRFISENTLGIYLVHGLLIHSTVSYLLQFDYLCNLPVSLLYAGLILCASLAIVTVIKKIPYIKNLV